VGAVTAREEMIEAIERYALALRAWSTNHPNKRPRLEDFVGHLLPDDKGVPPTAYQYGWVQVEHVNNYTPVGSLQSEPGPGREPLYRFRPSAVPTIEEEQ
jgi:hypothetical protein